MNEKNLLTESRTLRKNTQEWDTASQFLEAEKGRLRNQLEKLQNEVKNIEIWKKTEETAKLSIAKLIKDKSDINFDPNSFPDIFFIPENQLKKIGLTKRGGIHISHASLIIVGVPEPSSEHNYAQLEIPYHELLHSVADIKISATVEEKENKFFKWRKKSEIKIVNALTGFTTSGKELRGEGLEEAFVHYYAHEAFLMDTQPDTVQNKKKFLVQFFQSQIDQGILPESASADILNSITNSSDEVFSEIEKKLRPQMRTKFGERQNKCFAMLEALILRAESINKKENLEKLLFIAKTDGKKRKELFDLLKQIIGDTELVRRIYKVTSRDFNELDSITNDLSHT